jgi:hypothetical protein
VKLVLEERRPSRLGVTERVDLQTGVLAGAGITL